MIIAITVLSLLLAGAIIIILQQDAKKTELEENFRHQREYYKKQIQELCTVVDPILKKQTPYLIKALDANGKFVTFSTVKHRGYLADGLLSTRDLAYHEAAAYRMKTKVVKAPQRTKRR